MEILCIAILAAFLVDPIRAIDCSHNKCMIQGLQHPLCEYANPLPSLNCGKVFSVGFSQSERNEVIATHNQIRWYVSQGLELAGKPGPQPPAENMHIMVWDDQLARTAQRWVNQCKLNYAPCVDEERFEVGQSAGWTQTDGEKIGTRPSEIIYKFYNQVKDMDGKQVSNFQKNDECKMYTQLVWANTNKLGCGKIVYRQVDDKLTYYLLCLYGPRGNEIGKSIYKTLMY